MISKPLTQVLTITALLLLNLVANAQEAVLTDSIQAAKPIIIGEAPFDLANWGLCIPEEDLENYGNAIEIKYPRILDYKKDETIKKYMYVDKADNGLTFYTFPSGITPKKSQYSRTELRQRKQPNANAQEVKWGLNENVHLKGEYKIEEMFKKDNQFGETIFLQVYSNSTSDIESKNNLKEKLFYPTIKISWENGLISVKSRTLKTKTPSFADALNKENWEEGKDSVFKQKIDFDKFTIEIKTSEGKIEVILNGNESIMVNNAELKLIKGFENFFRTGNFLQSLDPHSFSKVKIYSLDIAKGN
jgi:hypothetical protein